jgi:hypothetical protein
MKTIFSSNVLICLLLISACGRNYEFGDPQKRGLKTVELREEESGFKLYRNGKPYYIQGAGGTEYLSIAKESGANSIRTWSSNNAKALLDSAEALGLTVTLGLDIGRPRLGFDYGNAKAVDEQKKWVKEEVLKYKDHPALLMWAVGNEVNEDWGDDRQLWKGVNDLAKMIHELDPNHPTTTMIAPKTLAIQYIKYFCPDIDILSINTFGALDILSNKLRRTFLAWNGAYIVSEWGPTGHWEADSTQWSIPIEQTSSEKAEFCKKSYNYIQKDKEKCIGNYVFFWGHKQERTATWFSLFSERGEKTETVDVMNYMWTGKWPVNRVPSVSSIRLDGKLAIDNIIFYADSIKTHVATLNAIDPDNDSLTYYWQLMHEAVDLKQGGDGEVSPDEVWNVEKISKGNKFLFKAPKIEGGYRLYVYVTDGKKNVATANIPFYVLFH